MHGNPRARALADELRQAHAQPQALVAALLQRFNHEPFAYTLKPPATGADGVDDFLFDTRSGFCAHYAGAMAFVPRRGHSCASGGRLPGRRAESGGQLPGASVRRPRLGRVLAAGAGLAERRPDLPGGARTDRTGWSRPWPGTASTSPTHRCRQATVASPWLNDMRLAWDSLNYGWQRWVLVYQGEQQGAFLQRWFGGLDPTRLGLLLGAAAILSVGSLALFLLKPWQAVAICAAANCAASNACWRCMACAVPRRRATLLRRARRPRPAGAGASHRGLRRRARSATLWTRRCR